MRAVYSRTHGRAHSRACTHAHAHGALAPSSSLMLVYNEVLIDTQASLLRRVTRSLFLPFHLCRLSSLDQYLSTFYNSQEL
jgi:hypothetical protein